MGMMSAQSVRAAIWGIGNIGAMLGGMTSIRRPGRLCFAPVERCHRIRAARAYLIVVHNLGERVAEKL
jgi:hypothetical protein